MKRGFTLIELLIVIAIIAILALIAVPNFLEAQVRAKISRAHADERTIAVAIESYAVDWGRPPIGGNEGKNNSNSTLGLGWSDVQRDRAYNFMTTPIAYISSPPHDPFIDRSPAYNQNQGKAKPGQKYYTYQYLNISWQPPTSSFNKAYNRGYTFYIRSPGPSKIIGKPYFAQMTTAPDYGGDGEVLGLGMVYDSSNGTISVGNLYRTNRGYFAGPNG